MPILVLKNQTYKTMTKYPHKNVLLLVYYRNFASDLLKLPFL